MNPSHSHKTADRIPITALFAANAISMIGNMVAMIAIPWFVLKTTGSPSRMGITGFFNIFPVVLAGLLGGALVDRIGYKGTSIIADIASGIAVVLIPILYATIGLPFWVLMVLVFLGALLDAPGGTARAALVPDLAELAGMPIERATSINQVIERGSRLVGAPLGGLLIAMMGTTNALWLDALSFLISALLVTFFIQVQRTRVQPKKQENYWGEIAAGLKFLVNDKLLRIIVVVVMITNFLDSAFSGVILPIYVNQIFGNALSLGLIIAMNGGGAVLGALIFGWIGHRLPRHFTFVSMFMLTGLRFFIYVLYPPLWVILVSTFVISVGAGPLNPIIDSISYERIPADMRGRVFGVITAGAWAAMPFSVLVAGFLTERIGLMAMLIGIGIAYFATTISMAVMPDMRAMNNRKKTSVDAG